MKKVYTVIIFATLSFSSFCQYDYILRDYIIKLDGDTTFYNVSDINTSFKNNFKTITGSNIFRADKALGFKKGLYEYRVKRINNLPEFLRIVCEGKLCLYQVGEELEENGFGYYLENNGKIVGIPKNFTTKKEIIDFFRKNEDLAIAIENKCFEYEDFPKLVQLYNNWEITGIEKFIKNYIEKNNKKNSQGYVILNNGDTVFGEIDYSEVESDIIVTDLHENETSYYPKDIEGFYLNNYFYRSVNKKRSKIYKEHINGKVRLFSIKKSSYSGYIHNTGTSYGGGGISIYIDKEESEKVIELNNSNLVKFFIDHKFLYEKINLGYYEIKDIETIVNIYNYTN